MKREMADEDVHELSMIVGGASPMPSELRDAIRWAEQYKQQKPN